MTKLQDFLNASIRDVTAMRVAPKAGDLFGVELECEGKNVDWDGGDAAFLRDWAPHHDGSLRAHHGSCCEWVFNGPVKIEKSVQRVNGLFDYFDNRKAKLVCSNRTSMHVHYNMGDKTAYQLVNMFILFVVLEDILDSYCGDNRKGNLFCLSSRHAEDQVRWMQDSCFKNFNFGNWGENQRYTSLNLAAINKFGTVEFRAMRGLDNREDALDWLSIVSEFCEFACYKMKNPVNLIEEISVKTPLGFIQEVFSAKNVTLLTANLDDNQINGSVYEGLRLVQMLAYRIGTEFDQVRLRGRDFWASFGGAEDEEPELDVDPRNIIAGQQGAARARPVRGAALAEAGAAIARAEAQARGEARVQLDEIFVNAVRNPFLPQPAGNGFGQVAAGRLKPMKVRPVRFVEDFAPIPDDQF